MVSLQYLESKALSVGYSIERFSSTRAQVPEGARLSDRTGGIKRVFDGVGSDGRPTAYERYGPRTPFLVVEPRELYVHGRSDRMENSRARAQCEAAKQRRSKQVREPMKRRFVFEDHINDACFPLQGSSSTPLLWFREGEGPRILIRKIQEITRKFQLGKEGPVCLSK